MWPSDFFSVILTSNAQTRNIMFRQDSDGWVNVSSDGELVEDDDGDDLEETLEAEQESGAEESGAEDSGAEESVEEDSEGEDEEAEDEEDDGEESDDEENVEEEGEQAEVKAPQRTRKSSVSSKVVSYRQCHSRIGFTLFPVSPATLSSTGICRCSNSPTQPLISAQKLSPRLSYNG